MLENTLNLIEPIKDALIFEGYTKPTPIQEQTIPISLEGKDILGIAQTGTGKTAAFAIPILQNIAINQESGNKKREIQSLIVAPTRELAIQIKDSFNKYSKNLNIRTAAVYGGVALQPQTRKLKKGVDILVATPGRLLDLTRRKFVRLGNVKCLVLDEADMMLDMGMIDDVKKIINYLPEDRQNMLFSATMPSEIEKLTKSLLKDPVKVDVTPKSSTIEKIDQRVCFVSQESKTDLLMYLLENESIESALVFTRTKRQADKLTKSLVSNGFKADSIHGDKKQSQRQKALKDFKERRIRILVATDIAARGIDIEELSHVINYSLPELPETYIHRIGRTGRIGNEGMTISFCSNEERFMLNKIEKHIDKKMTVITEHPYQLKDKPKNKSKNKNRRRKKSNAETSIYRSKKKGKKKTIKK